MKSGLAGRAERLLTLCISDSTVEIVIEPSADVTPFVVSMSIILDPGMMRLTDLPDLNDATAIFEFAMTFNGYEFFGSFDASADAAASGDRSSLKLIRNELFFAARASRHGDDERLIELYRELQPLFAKRHLSITRA